MTTTSTETGNVTGTKDKDYNLIWFTETCLSNALRLETYIQDAERDGDSELADLFRKAQAEAARAPSRASSCSAAVSAADYTAGTREGSRRTGEEPSSWWARRSDGSCALSVPAASLARDMGTTQGADAPDEQTPPGVRWGGRRPGRRP